MGDNYFSNKIYMKIQLKMKDPQNAGKRFSLIRKYEEKIYFLFLKVVLPGTIHQSQGQEATAVGMLFDLRKEDYMTSTHRPAGHCLAKGVKLDSMMAEMFAKKNGCCKGKGGAMHTGDYFCRSHSCYCNSRRRMPVAVGIGISCK